MTISTKHASLEMPAIVLGSTSPFRKQLLEKLHLDFSQDAPDIDETPLNGETAKQMVLRLAKDKAKVFKAKYPQHILITSDQCAVFDKSPIGKPHTVENAVKQLSQFSGKPD